MDCSPPASSVHGISQARVLEWVAISFSRGSSLPRGHTQVSISAGKFFTIWATRDKEWPSASLASTPWQPWVVMGAREDTETQRVRLQTPKSQPRSQHLPCSQLCLLHARFPTHPTLRVVPLTVGDAGRGVMGHGSLRTVHVIPGGQPLTILPQGRASASRALQTCCLSPAPLRFRQRFLFQVSVGPCVGPESQPQPAWWASHRSPPHMTYMCSMPPSCPKSSTCGLSLCGASVPSLMTSTTLFSCLKIPFLILCCSIFQSSFPQDAFQGLPRNKPWWIPPVGSSDSRIFLTGHSPGCDDSG